MVRSLVRNWDLTSQLARRSFTARYKGSLLGVAWAVLHPLAMLAIYTLVFGFVFRSRWARMSGDSQLEFALALFCGLIPYTLFSDVLNRSPLLITAVPNYVKKVVFPLECLCVAEVLAAIVHAVISLALLIAAVAIVLGQVHLTLLALPLALAPLVFLTLGLSWFLASLGVFLRDLAHTISLVTMMLFFLTPIFYDRQSPHIPQLMRDAMLANPLTVIVETFRGAILWGDWPNWAALAIVTAISFTAMVAGFAWFAKSRKAFSDVI